MLSPSSEFEIEASGPDASLTAMLQAPHFDRVRAHHLKTYADMIMTCASHPALSFEQAAILRTTDDTNTFLAQNELSRLRETPEARAAWRRRNTLVEDLLDDSLPGNHGEDYLGVPAKPVDYRNARAADFIAMLTLPTETTVTIGMQPDGICAAAICGLHCTLDTTIVEQVAATIFHSKVQQYLALPEVQERAATQPASFAMQVESHEQWPPMQYPAVDIDGTFGTTELDQMVSRIELPLGLFRDTLTWVATAGRLTTFSELPQFNHQ